MRRPFPILVLLLVKEGFVSVKLRNLEQCGRDLFRPVYFPRHGCLRDYFDMTRRSKDVNIEF